jgi:hypothetical protein
MVDGRMPVNELAVMVLQNMMKMVIRLETRATLLDFGKREYIEATN